MKAEEMNKYQLIWGVVLMVAGVGVFYRIPQVMPSIAELETFAPIIPGGKKAS